MQRRVTQSLSVRHDTAKRWGEVRETERILTEKEGITKELDRTKRPDFQARRYHLEILRWFEGSVLVFSFCSRELCKTSIVESPSPIRHLEFRHETVWRNEVGVTHCLFGHVQKLIMSFFWGFTPGAPPLPPFPPHPLLPFLFSFLIPKEWWKKRFQKKERENNEKHIKKIEDNKGKSSTTAESFIGNVIWWIENDTTIKTQSPFKIIPALFVYLLIFSFGVQSNNSFTVVLRDNVLSLNKEFQKLVSAKATILGFTLIGLQRRKASDRESTRMSAARRKAFRLGCLPGGLGRKARLARATVPTQAAWGLVCRNPTKAENKCFLSLAKRLHRWPKMASMDLGSQFDRIHHYVSTLGPIYDYNWQSSSCLASPDVRFKASRVDRLRSHIRSSKTQGDSKYLCRTHQHSYFQDTRICRSTIRISLSFAAGLSPWRARPWRTSRDQNTERFLVQFVATHSQMLAKKYPASLLYCMNYSAVHTQSFLRCQTANEHPCNVFHLSSESVYCLKCNLLDFV